MSRLSFKMRRRVARINRASRTVVWLAYSTCIASVGLAISIFATALRAILPP